MKENLSAFIDDELDERTSQQVLDRLHADGDLRDEFALQVMIGDVLRGDTGFDARFTASVMSRLDDEPTVLAPVAFRVQPEAKRLWMPAAAAVAGVALVSWLGLDFMSAPDVQPQLAVAPVVVPVQLAQTESPFAPIWSRIRVTRRPAACRASRFTRAAFRIRRPTTVDDRAGSLAVCVPAVCAGRAGPGAA
ncbi:MAG: sigma-E factor negative regulatory protein [Methyloversatilis sp.]|uniref:sigma-E factor negative regulatory protein n=1 Tax=Methyloversatilis sp. TaxID=2569862 RepID=UPI0025E786D8|nr:RseA family anti-sigma factor [Methyloversatilis sp.]MCR6666942.1 sigma-E factor negative regulatory protein [Methyloversatilis sp.]